MDNTKKVKFNAIMVHGIEMYTQNNHIALLLCELIGHSYIDMHHLNVIKKLGFELEIMKESDKKKLKEK